MFDVTPGTEERAGECPDCGIPKECVSVQDDRKVARGKCPDCGYRIRLRKDGSVQTHKLYVGTRMMWCPRDRTFPIFGASS